MVGDSFVLHLKKLTLMTVTVRTVRYSNRELDAMRQTERSLEVQVSPKKGPQGDTEDSVGISLCSRAITFPVDGPF